MTVQLLVVAYIASSLPTNARVLVGSVSQLQPSLRNAARAHGAGADVAWARALVMLSRAGLEEFARRYPNDLPGLGRLTGVFARHRAERGEEAGIRLDPEGCHVFPADQAAAPAPPAALTVAAPTGA
jgi:hypothetical protein